MVTGCFASWLFGPAGNRSHRNLIQPIQVRFPSSPGTIYSPRGPGLSEDSRKKKPLHLGMCMQPKSASGQQAHATAGAEDSSFGPSPWDDFFVSYTPPASKMSEEWMKGRADELKREVHRMFEPVNGMTVAGLLVLVDALERLGIDNYFQEDIDRTLSHVHTGDLETQSSDELHIVALRFRLLRQHGHFVPTDVFDKFRDGTGNFKTCLSRDPKGLLSLYNAAHMAAPGEDVLNDAITFSRTHLEAMKGKLQFPIAGQIYRALDIPLPRYMPQLETMHFITEYDHEDGYNTALLELARLHYCLTRSAQLKELQSICLWWKDLYKDINLTYSRYNIIGTYFWCMLGVIRDERSSQARTIVTKLMALLTVMDDTFDNYATFEDSKKLNEAIQRWDESAASIVPEYLRMFYTKLLSYFNVIEDILEPGEKYRAHYVKKEIMLWSKYAFEELKWCNEKYIPNFKDKVKISSLTVGIRVHLVTGLMVAGSEVTKEAFEWASGTHDMIDACGEILRFMNDISSYKKRVKDKNEVTTSLECYMKEHGTTVEETMTALSAMVEHAWRRINKGFMEIDRGLLPTASVVINDARATMVFYNGGNDRFTIATDLDDSITSFFVKPVSLLNDE